MSRLPKGLSVVPMQDCTIVRLYKTNILTIDRKNNVIQFETGGWKSRHTKKCMNLILQEFNLNVRQKNFEWYVVSQDDTVEFQDGMRIAI